MPLLALVFAFYLSLATAASAADRWQRPVDGPLLRPFSLAADRFAAGQHRGVDLGAPLGTAVRAACGGRVSFAGTVPGGGGRTVSVRCGRLIATYQQLGAVSVRRGRLLVPGAPLGTVGPSRDPRMRRPHLHLGAREAAGDRYVDPMTLLGDAARTPPLLPAGRRPAGRPFPLGPAPAPALARPVRAPSPARAPARPLRAPSPARAPARPVRAPSPARAPARPVPAAGTPWVVWIGLLCIGLGMPLGGLVSRRRRRRRSVPVAVAATAT